MTVNTLDSDAQRHGIAIGRDWNNEAEAGSSIWRPRAESNHFKKWWPRAESNHRHKDFDFGRTAYAALNFACSEVSLRRNRLKAIVNPL